MPDYRSQRRDRRLQRVTGVFEHSDSRISGFHPESTPRPHVTIGIEIAEAFGAFPFLVDSGADSTMLAPAAAYELLGPAYLDLDFVHDPHASVSVGIGGYARDIACPATYHIVTDDDTLIDFYAPIELAEPIPPYPSHEGNWIAPNLLGRDVLRFFEVHLDYYPQPELHLWYDSVAAAEEIERLHRWFRFLEEYEE